MVFINIHNIDFFQVYHKMITIFLHYYIEESMIYDS